MGEDYKTMALRVMLARSYERASEWLALMNLIAKEVGVQVDDKSWEMIAELKALAKQMENGD